MKEKITIIDLVSSKIQEILDDVYKDDLCKPTFMISTMYKKGYVLTLIHSTKQSAYDYRQSEFINLDTDLKETIEYLYNRTT